MRMIRHLNLIPFFKQDLPRFIQVNRPPLAVRFFDD